MSKSSIKPALPRPILAAVALLVVLATASSSVPAADDASAQALLHGYKCYLCHADDTPKAGPAYRDVAAFYRGRRDGQSRVVGVIKRGQHGGGPWHMPPHPEVSDADARAMARYILSRE
jgi:cytochrome c551/c552